MNVGDNPTKPSVVSPAMSLAEYIDKNLASFACVVPSDVMAT
jgi:hypothetical protein